MEFISGKQLGRGSSTAMSTERRWEQKLLFQLGNEDFMGSSFLESLLLSQVIEIQFKVAFRKTVAVTKL